MASKQELRSVETKRSIVEAANNLFANKGYDAVTMREIAKEAGCSHTTIYIYFKDKEALLQQLSMPSLLSFMKRMDMLLEQESHPDDKLIAISLAFIEFCLTNRNRYTLFFNVKATQVNEEAPEMEINQIRNKMFGKLSKAIEVCLELAPGDGRLLLYSRIYFFTLQGIIATYANSEESVEQLMGRLIPTFEQAFEVLLIGFKNIVHISET